MEETKPPTNSKAPPYTLAARSKPFLRIETMGNGVVRVLDENGQPFDGIEKIEFLPITAGHPFVRAVVTFMRMQTFVTPAAIATKKSALARRCAGCGTPFGVLPVVPVRPDPGGATFLVCERCNDDLAEEAAAVRALEE